MKTEQVETAAERAMREFRQEMAQTPCEEIELVREEKRIQELANAWAREAMGEVMKRADTTAPEVDIAGERWGNRRVSKGEYETVFGLITLERSAYQRSGRGRVAIPMDLRLGIVEGR